MSSLNNKYKTSIKTLFNHNEVKSFHSIDEYVDEVSYLLGEEVKEEQLTAVYNFFNEDVSAVEAAEHLK